MKNILKALLYTCLIILIGSVVTIGIIKYPIFSCVSGAFLAVFVLTYITILVITGDEK